MFLSILGYYALEEKFSFYARHYRLYITQLPLLINYKDRRSIIHIAVEIKTMAEIDRFHELEMNMLMHKIPQRILVPATATLIFGVGFMVGGDHVNEVPVMIRQAGFLAFMFAFLCCVASICIYMNLRSELLPPTTWKLSVSTLTMAALVTGMYAVLTHSSYTRLWISVTVVGLVCFPILTYVVYAMTVELNVAIAIASAIPRLLFNLPTPTINLNIPRDNSS